MATGSASSVDVALAADGTDEAEQSATHGSNEIGPDGKPLYQQPVRNPNKSKRKKRKK